MLNKTALELMLDAAAPDSESWMRGHEQYEAGATLEEILDAAAPDSESWRRGQAVYVAVEKVTTHNSHRATAPLTASSFLQRVMDFRFNDKQFASKHRSNSN